ncbi:type I glutamate--ammonia ligase [Bdellovibrionota bacterium]
MSPKEAIGYVKEAQAKMIDLKFQDFVGMWKHFSVPVSQFNESSFEDGFGFDASSIAGWQPINISDMLVIPDPNTACIDPFMEAKTVSFICDIADPVTKEPYSRDPRHIAKKVEKHLRSTGLADEVFVGPEAEFFIFDDVRYDQSKNSGYYFLDSIEGHWNTGREEFPNLAYKSRHKEGYFSGGSSDKFNDIRTEMVLELEKLGIEVEAQHHEVATGGQGEIDIRYQTLVKIADQVMWFKYVVKNVAARHKKTATFMPKPLFEDNGSGMHTHISLWKGGKNIFAGDKYAGLSQTALYFIGGMLKHAGAVCAFSNPTTNSYKRLVPGFEAPVNLAYSSRNRSAAIRLPMYSASDSSKRIEFRTPDPTCNAYLAFAAMVMAGLDGVEKKIDPGDPLDKDIYGLSPEELREVPSAPHTLDEALKALEKDHKFLLKGDVFTQDVIDMWIDYKRKNEVDEVRLRPTPHEFALYFDF